MFYEILFRKFSPRAGSKNDAPKTICHFARSLREMEIFVCSHGNMDIKRVAMKNSRVGFLERDAEY